MLSSSGISDSGSLVGHLWLSGGKAQLGDLEIQACVLVLPGWEPLGNLPPSVEKNQKPCQIVNLELLTRETAS